MAREWADYQQQVLALVADRQPRHRRAYRELSSAGRTKDRLGPTHVLQCLRDDETRGIARHFTTRFLRQLTAAVILVGVDQRVDRARTHTGAM